MALCRCKEKHGNPKGRKVCYKKYVEPFGFPESSSICGRYNCDNPGIIWLTKEEWEKYKSGVKIFSYASSASKVRVK